MIFAHVIHCIWQFFFLSWRWMLNHYRRRCMESVYMQVDVNHCRLRWKEDFGLQVDVNHCICSQKENFFCSWMLNHCRRRLMVIFFPVQADVNQCIWSIRRTLVDVTNRIWNQWEFFWVFFLQMDVKSWQEKMDEYL